MEGALEAALILRPARGIVREPLAPGRSGRGTMASLMSCRTPVLEPAVGDDRRGDLHRVAGELHQAQPGPELLAQERRQREGRKAHLGVGPAPLDRAMDAIEMRADLLPVEERGAACRDRAGSSAARSDSRAARASAREQVRNRPCSAWTRSTASPERAVVMKKVTVGSDMLILGLRAGAGARVRPRTPRRSG